MNIEKILLVDDTKSIIDLINLTLTSKGYTVFIALNGIQALKIAAKQQPALILLDIMMPEMDGYETCRQLKENEQTRNIPVIFLSALTKTFDKVKAFQSGGVDYLSKPIEIEELLVRVQTHLTISRLQNELRESNEKLEEKVKSRTQELLETNTKLEIQNQEYAALNEEYKAQNEELLTAKEKAEESDNLKSAFLNNMSHEVRTPLNAIVGFSQLMVESEYDKLDVYSKLIADSGEKLVQIITDVIEISQIHANQVKTKYTEIELITFINEITAVFHGIAEEKGIRLLLNINIPYKEYYILSDTEKLNRIFNHLIDNAIKFTHQGAVEVSFDLKQDYIWISISDTGIGISDEMQKIIFEPFRQVETGICRNYGGLGLGLSITKTYIELLNGSISLKSKVNEGTTIIISIPAANTAISTNFKDADIKQDSTNTILIVEDEHSNYFYLKELLAVTNAKVLHAENGQLAIDICRNNRDIDLILMDIKMPVMDGHTAAKLIKAFRPGLPIIAQTAYALEYEKEKFINDFDDYITKPINKEILKQKVMKYI